MSDRRQFWDKVYLSIADKMTHPHAAEWADKALAERDKRWKVEPHTSEKPIFWKGQPLDEFIGTRTTQELADMQSQVQREIDEAERGGNAFITSDPNREARDYWMLCQVSEAIERDFERRMKGE